MPDHQLIKPVAIPIDARCGATEISTGEVRPQLGAFSFAKPAVLHIVKELRRHRVRSAIPGEVVDVTVCHEQVGPAIAIGVEELSAKAQHRISGVLDPRLCDRIDEQSRRWLQVEIVVLLFKVGDEQIEPTIAIRIRRRDSHAGLSLPRMVEGESR